jgi:ABC-type uncharacterized transport system substrate-binding protein
MEPVRSTVGRLPRLKKLGLPVPPAKLTVSAPNELELATCAGVRYRFDTRAVGLPMLFEFVSALLVASDTFFFGRREPVVTLAARHRIPAIYYLREFVEAGGLLSYGNNLADVYRQVGVYVGRILKGEKPGDLPVVQSTRFELVINLKAAKALGMEIPIPMQLLADQVIE